MPRKIRRHTGRLTIPEVAVTARPMSLADFRDAIARLTIPEVAVTARAELNLKYERTRPASRFLKSR